MEKILIDNKYEIVLNDGNNKTKFSFYATRYGEKWKDLVGDNLMLGMFNRIKELEIENEKLKTAKNL